MKNSNRDMNRYHKYSNNLYEETRYNITIKILKKYCNPQDAICVDLGAGNNPISNYIGCKKTIKIDFNLNNNPDILSDISNNIPLCDNVCDIVIAGEILEHVYFSKNLLININRILKEGGYLLLTVPNSVYFLYRILWLFGKIPRFAAKADFTYLPSGKVGGHIRDYNFKELEDILRILKFDIIKSTTNGIVYNRLFIPSIFIPKTFGQKIIILARKTGKSGP